MARARPLVAGAGRLLTVLGLICLVLAAANYSNHFFDSNPSEVFRIVAAGVLGATISAIVKIKLNETFLLIISAALILTIQVAPATLMLVTDHAILYLYGAVFLIGGLLGYCVKGASLAYSFVGIVVVIILYSFQSSSISFALASTLILVGFAIYFERTIIRVGALAIVPLVFIITGPTKHKSQAQFEDRVVVEIESDYGKVAFTKWNNNTTIYVGKKKQLSSGDAYLYYEPMVLPGLSLVKSQEPRVLIIGGDLGFSAKEVLRTTNPVIDMVPLDTVLTQFAKYDQDMSNISNHSLESSKLNIRFGEDPFEFLQNSTTQFDLIIVDTPDPTSIELNQYFTNEFYELCKKRLTNGGFLITQAGSPYYAYRAFISIEQTMQSAGFATLALHNQILTLGEWAWIIASPSMDDSEMLDRIKDYDFDNSGSRWLNNEAIDLITSFGKPMVFPDSIALNTIQAPSTYIYFNEGNWEHN